MIAENIPRRYLSINEASQMLNVNPKVLRHTAYMLGLLQYRSGKKQKLAMWQIERIMKTQNS
jgi:hypothetical protein